MWGFYNSRNRSLATKIFEMIIDKNISRIYNPVNGTINKKGHDQFFLEEYVHPLIHNRSVTHDSFICERFGGDPFPTKRVGNCFIGSTNGCNTTGVFFKDCPIKCRPKNHQDWNQC